MPVKIFRAKIEQVTNTVFSLSTLTFANTIKSLSGMEVEVVKRSELHTFEAIPKRWVVERTFAWLDHYRRLWKNCERNLQNTFQMVTIAFSCPRIATIR